MSKFQLLIPALGKQSQVDPEFEASLVYRASSRTAWAIQRNPVLKKKAIKKKCHLVEGSVSLGIGFGVSKVQTRPSGPLSAA